MMCVLHNRQHVMVHGGFQRTTYDDLIDGSLGCSVGARTRQQKRGSVRSLPIAGNFLRRAHCYENRVLFCMRLAFLYMMLLCHSLRYLCRV